MESWFTKTYFASIVTCSDNLLNVRKFDNLNEISKNCYSWDKKPQRKQTKITENLNASFCFYDVIICFRLNVIVSFMNLTI